MSQGLCNKVLGIEKGSGACFNYQIKKCRGACVGEDPLLLHEARLTAALANLKLRSWPFEGPAGVKEVSPSGDREEIHLFDQWRHLGTAANEDELLGLLAEQISLPFDLDGYKILTRFLDKKKCLNFMDLSQKQAEQT
jgi:DNA polymerase-3 subunit epsilon